MNRRNLISALIAGFAAILFRPAPLKFRAVFVRTKDKWEHREFEHLKPGDTMVFADDMTVEYRVKTVPVPCDPPGNWIVEMEGASRKS